MNIGVHWIGLILVGAIAASGARAAFIAFNTKERKDILRVLFHGIALCVIGPLWFAGAMMPLFTLVNGADPAQRAALLNAGMPAPALVMRAGFAAGCALLLISAIARRLGK